MVIFVSDLSSGFPLSLYGCSWSLSSHPRGIHSAEEKAYRRPISLCLNTYQISNVDTRLVCMAWLLNYMLLSHWRWWPQVEEPKNNTRGRNFSCLCAFIMLNFDSKSQQQGDGKNEEKLDEGLLLKSCSEIWSSALFVAVGMSASSSWEWLWLIVVELRNEPLLPSPPVVGSELKMESVILSWAETELIMF